jgi:hypothetical protein
MASPISAAIFEARSGFASETGRHVAAALLL